MSVMIKFVLSLIGIFLLLILVALILPCKIFWGGSTPSNYGPEGSLYVYSNPKETHYIKINDNENPSDNIYIGVVYSSLYSGSPYEEMIYQGQFQLEGRTPEAFNPRNHSDIMSWHDGRISLKDGGHLQAIDPNGFIKNELPKEGPNKSYMVEQVSTRFFFKVEHGDNVEDDLYVATFYQVGEKEVSHTGDFIFIKNSSNEIVHPVKEFSYFSWEGDAFLLKDGSYLESVDLLPEWIK